MIKQVILQIVVTLIMFICSINSDIITLDLNKDISNNDYTTNQNEEIESLRKEVLELKKKSIAESYEDRKEQIKKDELEKEQIEKEREKESETQVAEVIYEEPVYEEVVSEEVVYEEPAILPNSIGINGDYRQFYEVGYTSDTGHIQGIMDKGNLVACFSPFIPNDGELTYFVGHNPGIFTYMANSVYVGAVVSIVDDDGTIYNYKMIENVVTDTKAYTNINSIGKTVRDAYNYGTGQESIIMQYCIGESIMVWYGVPI